jgi:hypothetical protein
MDPPTIASSFRDNGASYGLALPDKQSVVYIVRVVLAVTIAMSTSFYATNIKRIDSNSSPSVFCY